MIRHASWCWIHSFVRQTTVQTCRSITTAMNKAVLDSRQGDTIFINCKNIPSIDVDITSAWQEHCDVEYDKSMNIDLSREHHTGSFVVSASSAHKSSTCLESDTSEAVAFRPTLKITIPEVFNVVYHAKDTSVRFRNKILGDVSVECVSGDVSIEQMRGDNISICCNEADVTVVKKLEGSIYLSCNTLAAQMMHGNKLIIAANMDVNIKAVYSVNCAIESHAGSVVVGLSHGHSVVKSAVNCNLSGVDGSFAVDCVNGNASIQINKLYPGSSSKAVCNFGSISALVDPEVVANLTCQTKFENEITVQSDSYKSRYSSPHSTEGILSGQSKAVKRPFNTSRKFSRKSGKIDIDGAEILSLRSTIKSEDTSTNVVGAVPELPCLTFEAQSGVGVESVSWIGKILRKYDFQHENIQNK